MSIYKILLTGAFVLFAAIGVVALVKKEKKPVTVSVQTSYVQDRTEKRVSLGDLPNVDRISQLFSTDSPYKLPIVETITYASSVPWLKGRPAWVADYAAYYNTSKHFIARSLNNSPDYFSQKVTAGSRFNVFKKGIQIEFHLVVDLQQCKMAFYYLNLDSHERVLLKVYRVGVGRIDPSKESGTLTPLGVYQLGDKVAMYSPGVTGFFHDQKTEMVRVFGSRWIPFGLEIQGCTEPSKGYGIHGAPWVFDSVSKGLVENRGCIGKYESDGCIRLLSEDIEEIYAIVVSKPTFIHIAKKIQDVKLPGVEVGTPSR